MINIIGKTLTYSSILVSCAIISIEYFFGVESDSYKIIFSKNKNDVGTQVDENSFLDVEVNQQPPSN